MRISPFKNPTAKCFSCPRFYIFCLSLPSSAWMQNCFGFNSRCFSYLPSRFFPLYLPLPSPARQIFLSFNWSILEKNGLFPSLPASLNFVLYSEYFGEKTCSSNPFSHTLICFFFSFFHILFFYHQKASPRPVGLRRFHSPRFHHRYQQLGAEQPPQRDFPPFYFGGVQTLPTKQLRCVAVLFTFPSLPSGNFGTKWAKKKVNIPNP